VRYYDAVNFGRAAKAQAFVTTGFIDIVCRRLASMRPTTKLSGKKHI